MNAKTRIPSLALAGLLAVATAAGADPDALDRRVSLNLQDSDAAEAFRSIARVAGVRIEHDGLGEEKVSLELENVRVRTLLTALCDSLGCRWELTAGTPPLLRVVPLPGERPPARAKPSPAALETAIDLHVKAANVRDLLESVAQITSTRAFVDSAVQGSISLDLVNTTIREILDTICRSARCAWSFDADKEVLAVRPRAQG